MYICPLTIVDVLPATSGEGEEEQFTVHAAESFLAGPQPPPTVHHQLHGCEHIVTLDVRDDLVHHTETYGCNVVKSISVVHSTLQMAVIIAIFRDPFKFETQILTYLLQYYFKKENQVQ